MIAARRSACSSISQLATDYDQLTRIQKMQIFELAIKNSCCDDLAKILWKKGGVHELHALTNRVCAGSWQHASIETDAGQNEYR